MILLASVFAVLTSFLAPFIALAQETTIVRIIDAFTGVFNNMVGLAIAVALVVFMWGVVMFILKAGDENAIAAGRKQMMWGVVALFILVTVWGLVTILQTLVGVDSTLTGCSSPSMDVEAGTRSTCL